MIRSKITEANLKSANGKIYSLGDYTVTPFYFSLSIVSVSLNLKEFLIATALIVLQKQAQRLPGLTFLLPLLCLIGIWALFKKVSYPLISIPASTADFKSTGPVIDFITVEEISNDQLKATRLFHVGQYVSDIVNILKIMLEANKCSRREIPHPTEARALNDDEKKKWLKEVAAFFSISSHDLEKCWDVNAEEVVKKTFNTYFGGLRRQMHGRQTDLAKLASKLEEKLQLAYLPILRRKKFLELIPTNIQKEVGLGNDRPSDDEVMNFFKEACDEVQLPEDIRQRLR